jgi:hypothetical protein
MPGGAIYIGFCGSQFVGNNHALFVAAFGRPSQHDLARIATPWISQSNEVHPGEA